ncbi:DUF2125 domain-containing protein [Arenibaculum pallidiluteum]|uniref:DUF2125 domain-containing protein n=1 Tax=Arenibaculum pallidiluteum TaxID=2812559 RepID=UPI001A9774E0|nr:DUF2125 domain-containing protein [Arenibaculum pallidiluteum]
MRKRLTLLLPLAVLLLGIAYAVAWWQAAVRLRVAVEDWAAEQRAQGGAVAHGPIEIGGFPGTLRARIPDVAVRLPDGLGWEGPEVLVSAAPWSPTRMAFALPGRHRLHLPAAGPRPELELIAEQGGSGMLDFAFGRGLAAGDLTLAGALLGLVGQETGRARAETLRLGLADLADGSAPAASLSVRSLVLPAAAASPLGPSVAEASAALRLAGPLPEGTAPEQLERWRAAGGAVQVEHLGIDYGPLKGEARGRVGLGPGLVPEGSLDAELRGLDRALDALVAAGAMRPNDATLAKVAVSFLARRRTPDGDAVVEAPMVLERGWLSLGPVRIAPLPSLGG